MIKLGGETMKAVIKRDTQQSRDTDSFKLHNGVFYQLKLPFETRNFHQYLPLVFSATFMSLFSIMNVLPNSFNNKY